VEYGALRGCGVLSTRGGAAWAPARSAAADRAGSAPLVGAEGGARVCVLELESTGSLLLKGCLLVVYRAARGMFAGRSQETQTSSRQTVQIITSHNKDYLFNLLNGAQSGLQS
jgi:hypothetical protein